MVYQVDGVDVHVYVPGQVELGGSDDRGDEALADVCAAGGRHVHPAPAPVVPAQAAGRRRGQGHDCFALAKFAAVAILSSSFSFPCEDSENLLFANLRRKAQVIKKSL